MVREVVDLARKFERYEDILAKVYGHLEPVLDFSLLGDCLFILRGILGNSSGSQLSPGCGSPHAQAFDLRCLESLGHTVDTLTKLSCLAPDSKTWLNDTAREVGAPLS